MRATDILREEHVLALRGLAILDAMRVAAVEGRPPTPDDARRIAAFFRDFVDGCHHAKEERVLFPAMEEVGFPRHGGPVGVMLHEHDVGRGYLGEVASAAEALGRDDAAAARFTAAAEGFRDLLGPHIQKENEILFRMAERALAGRDERLVADFERFEAEVTTAADHVRFRATLDDLALQYR